MGPETEEEPLLVESVPGCPQGSEEHAVPVLAVSLTLCRPS